MPMASVRIVTIAKLRLRRQGADGVAEILGDVLQQPGAARVPDLFLDRFQPAEGDQGESPGFLFAHPGLAPVLRLHLGVKPELLVELALLGAPKGQRSKPGPDFGKNAHGVPIAHWVFRMPLMAVEARDQTARSTSSWRRPAAVSS